MHRLPSLAVEYIKIVTHVRLTCNSIVASHTKPWAPWAPFRRLLALSGWGYADFHDAANFAITEFSEVRTKFWAVASCRWWKGMSCLELSGRKEACRVREGEYLGGAPR